MRAHYLRTAHASCNVYAMETTTGYALTNNTTGQTWSYDSEPQLKTATRLYAVQNPKASLTVTINGTAHKIR